MDAPLSMVNSLALTVTLPASPPGWSAWAAKLLPSVIWTELTGVWLLLTLTFPASPVWVEVVISLLLTCRVSKFSRLMFCPLPELVEAEISALFCRFKVLALTVRLPESPVPVACTVSFPWLSRMELTGF